MASPWGVTRYPKYQPVRRRPSMAFVAPRHGPGMLLAWGAAGALMMALAAARLGQAAGLEGFTAPPWSDLRAPHYRTCADARAAGAAPLRLGEAGYAPHLDRDNDGVACEPAPR